MTLKINPAGSPPVKTRNNVSSQQEKQEYKSLQRVLTLCANKVLYSKNRCSVPSSGGRSQATCRFEKSYAPRPVCCVPASRILFPQLILVEPPLPLVLSDLFPDNDTDQSSVNVSLRPGNLTRSAGL